MADRVDVVFVGQFVSMLVQTERFGTPIAHALGQFADSLQLRERRPRETAAKTGAKLLFPLVLFIFPSIFVVRSARVARNRAVVSAIVQIERANHAVASENVALR
jgi:pilus assembly protein TadC